MTDAQKSAAAWHAAHRAAERRADAEALAQYQRDCLASWVGIKNAHAELLAEWGPK